MNRRIPESREAITLASVKNWLRGPLYRLDYWRRQIPLALHVLREDGWVELLKAVRRKLRTVHFRPSASYRPVVAEIGAIARPRNVWIVTDMPKTRSGKIMRRVLSAISNETEVGDVTTLANPEIVVEITNMVQRK